jgi:hemoglobin
MELSIRLFWNEAIQIGSSLRREIRSPAFLKTDGVDNQPGGTIMFSRITAVSVVLGLAVSVSGCNTISGSNSAMASEQSLYDRLGGKPAITAVVDDFVARVAADTRINGKFANANIPRLKTMLVEQICQASGGPCTYTGRDMKSAHAGMGVSGTEFDALVGDLTATLTKFKVGEREKNELLGALGPMKKDIVEKPTAALPAMGVMSKHEASPVEQDARASVAF